MCVCVRGGGGGGRGGVEVVGEHCEWLDENEFSLLFWLGLVCISKI